MIDYPFFNELTGKLVENQCSMNSLIYEMLRLKAVRKDSEISVDLLKKLVRRYAEAERELARREEIINNDLKAAGFIQRSLLPQTIVHDPRLEIAWKFKPCISIGGDIFNYFNLSPDIYAFYILDVCGHGVSAAMIAVSVAQALQSHSKFCIRHEIGDRSTSILRPSEVLYALDKEFPLERFDCYFSLFYMLINVAEKTLTYSGGGHPPPLCYKTGGDLILLDKGGSLVGLNTEIPFDEGVVQLDRNDVCLLYTDGVTESKNINNDLYGDINLKREFAKSASKSAHTIADSIFSSVLKFSNAIPASDDISILTVKLL